jgi:hypothetical protein
MKWSATVVLILLCSRTPGLEGQVRAGSPEDRAFGRISAESNGDSKLALIAAFEKEFPQSKILGRVYLMAVDVFRERQDRAKINEYGEKALQADGANITALMLLARSYAMEGKNLDRAIELAKRAIARQKVLRTEPQPAGYSTAAWQDYMKTNEESAEQMLQYASAVKEHADVVRNAQAGAADNAAAAATQEPVR